ncbi:MAG: twin transmembrane helix small protein [Alphaproteobacteria bacterium]
MSGGHILVLIALFATLAILLVGVVGMARGGEFNRKYGNKLMRMRVISQFMTLILLLILGLMSVAD